MGADSQHSVCFASVARGTVAGRIPMRNFLLSTCMGAVAIFATGAAHANDELIRMSQNPKDWVMPTGDYANQRYSKLKQITADNVGKLQVAWTFSTGVLRGHEGGPLVIGDVMYFHGPFPNPVYALDLKNDAKILWKYEPKQDPNVIPVMCCDTVNRGLAYADGKIFLHQADTTLVALDAKDGKVVWQAKNGDPSKGETGTSAPMVIKDKVLIGISGGEFGVDCHVTAYDLKSGKQAWRAHSQGPDDHLLVDPEKTTALGKPIGKDSSLKTWQGDQWKTGGGCTWGWISYDPQLNLIYYGSGNPSTWNPSQRPGDNKWSMTVFARNPDTGMAKWVYQMTPHDEWDYDGVNEMILTDQQIGGQTRKLLTHFDRNGLGYTPGQPYVGATLSMYPPPGKSNMGNFIAWDGKTGKIVWSVPEQFSVWSGALATAGGVVFYGTLEGYLKAVDAKTGKELYKFKTPSGIIGNVTTYEHGGKQYIAILSGVGGWAGIGLAAGLTEPTEGLGAVGGYAALRSEEHTSELQSHSDLVCRLLLEKKKKNDIQTTPPILTEMRKRQQNIIAHDPETRHKTSPQ